MENLSQKALNFIAKVDVMTCDVIDVHLKDDLFHVYVGFSIGVDHEFVIPKKSVLTKGKSIFHHKQVDELKDKLRSCKVAHVYNPMSRGFSNEENNDTLVINLFQKTSKLLNDLKLEILPVMKAMALKHDLNKIINDHDICRNELIDVINNMTVEEVLES